MLRCLYGIVYYYYYYSTMLLFIELTLARVREGRTGVPVPLPTPLADGEEGLDVHGFRLVYQVVGGVGARVPRKGNALIFASKAII